MKRFAAQVLILLCFYNPVFAETPAIVQQAFDAMEAQKDVEWAYTRTTDDGAVTVERFDPRTQPKWTTLSVNGVEVASTEVKSESENGEDDEESDINDIAETDSWVLVADSETETTYTFTPKADDPEEAKFLKHLQGTMVIDKQNPHVKKFSLKALRKFKPMALVKVLNMQVDVEFADVGDGYYEVIREAEDVTVRVALIKQREKSETKYSDFVRIE